MNMNMFTQLTEYISNFNLPSLLHLLSIPPLTARYPLTPQTYLSSLPTTTLFLPFLISLSYLSRTPNTYTLRLGLLPITIWAVIKSFWSFVWVGEGLDVYNWGSGLASLVAISKALDYGLTKEGLYKIGEREYGLGGVQTPAIAKEEKVLSRSSIDETEAENDSGSGSGSGTGLEVGSGLVRRKELKTNRNGNGDGDDEIVDGNKKGLGRKDHSLTKNSTKLNSKEPTSTLTNRPLSSLLPPSLLSSLELIFSLRGIGWEWGQSDVGTLYIPSSPYPPHILSSKSLFLKEMGKKVLIHFMVIDFLGSCAKLVPTLSGSPVRAVVGFTVYSGVGTANAVIVTSAIEGITRTGTIFLPTLSPLPRYTLSTLIHLLTGFSILSGFQLIYSLITIFSVLLLKHDPRAWPPVVEEPWKAESLGEFWGRRWHLVLRRVFLVWGGVPVRESVRLVRRILGKVGRMIGFGNGIGNGNGNAGKEVVERKMASTNANAKQKRKPKPKPDTIESISLIIGTFLGSGIYHELSSYAMLSTTFPSPSHPLPHPTTVLLFFLLQSLLIILERFFKLLTGKKIKGWKGICWVWFVIGVAGQPLVDCWHRKGLAGGLVIPLFLSPTRRVLWPVLRWVGERCGVDGMVDGVFDTLSGKV